MQLRTTALVSLCVMLLVSPAAAQEQRGAIEGVVKDASGAVLPGASVEARSAAGAVVLAVTDGQGIFRFPGLLPGLYDVSASLSGFQPRRFERVEVLLGQIKRLEFVLAIAGVAEQVQVTAQSPLVDVKQSARATSLRDQLIELLPKGRDFTSFVTLAAGANSEPKLGGLSVDGSSAGENRFIIDGVETTNLRTGVSGKNLIADFVEEVQVKSSGYAAEFGGSTGGVVNVLTKSGTNQFRGNALFYWQGDKLTAGNRPILRRDVLDVTKAQYWTYPEDDENRTEPGILVGGPILRNRAWFFGAYQPALTKTTRTVNPQTSGNPRANTFNPVTQKNTVHYASGNSTAQLTNNVRTRVAYNNSWAKRTGLLPAQSGTDPLTTNYAIDRTFPNWTVSGSLDYVAKANLYIGARAGYYYSNYFDTGVPAEIRYLYSRGNVGMPGVPDAFQKATGFSTIPTNNAATRDEMTRLYFQADGTWYGSLGGQHTFKAGVQLDRVGNNVLSGEQRNLVRLQWGASLSGQRGTYGYYQVRSNGVHPEMGFITEGDIRTTNVGLFVQDAWTISNRLTVNAGLRTERERVPMYLTDPSIPKYGVEFNFGDKLAPRVGFAYDVKADGRWKAYGSWGIFYDIFKLELPRGSFGGDKWLEYYYTLDTYDYTTLITPGCPPACAGTLIRGPIDFRHVAVGSDYIDPDLKPMQLQEAALGIEHQLSPRLAAGVRYVRKWLTRAIEDTGALDPQQNEIYIIANPGFGLTKYAFPGVPYPKAKRQYDGVEFSVERRLANNWLGRASYTWSRLWGNYSGLSQSDENGRTSPNVGRVFDYPLMMFDEHGRPNYGRLATDRPHQLKLQGVYVFPFGTSAGASFFAYSGIPVTREIAVIPPNNFPVQYRGRMSDGRMPVLTQTDVYVQHEFSLPGGRSLQVNFNVANLFNQKTPINRFITYQDANGILFNEADFYAGRLNFDTLIQQQGIVQNPLFMKDNGYQAPLQARLGVKFTF